jgi:hypothetical protein
VASTGHGVRSRGHELPALRSPGEDSDGPVVPDQTPSWTLIPEPRGVLMLELVESSHSNSSSLRFTASVASPQHSDEYLSAPAVRATNVPHLTVYPGANG